MADQAVPTGLGRRWSALAPNVRGALWMTAAAAIFTFMTVLIKFLGSDYPTPVQVFYRQAAGVLVLAPLMIKHGKAAFVSSRPVMLLIRAGCGTFALMLAFYGYQKLPMAEANALSFTRALWLVPLAALVLREKVGPMRLLAVLAGFGGVLIMTRPEAGAGFTFGLPMAAMLLSGLLLALTVTSMKVMTRDHAPIVILVWGAILGVVFALPAAAFVWRWPALPDLGLLALMGVCGTVCQGCFIKSIQLGDAAVMASVDYVRLPFAAVIGYLIFREAPGPSAFLGAAVIVVSSLMITLHEQRLARRAAAEGEAAA